MKRIGVFYGGKSCEHEVSVITAVQMMAEMEDEYIVYPIYITEEGWFTGELLKNVESYKEFDSSSHVKVLLGGNKLYTKGAFNRIKVYGEIDVAVLCTHGGLGESGGLSGLLEMYGVPYVASSVLESAVCMDKEYFKIIAKDKGFRVVPGITVKKEGFEENADKICEKIFAKLGEDIIVKPVDLGSSIGVNVPKNIDELKDALSLVFSYTKKALVEKRITEMTELNCAACKMGESIIVSAIEKPFKKGDGILSYKDKYLTKSKVKREDREIPAKISPRLASKIRKLTNKLYEEFNLSGVVRVDYIYKEDSEDLYVNEVNTIPGSMGAYLFDECEIDYSCLIRGLIDSAEERFKKDNEFLSHFSSELLSGKYFVSKS